ncbi:MAG TPA: hypothetical protein VLC09_16230 [Polyangiaceae bacterium]|nr:hypothetical protein [Polyangiaceae bacterium]
MVPARAPASSRRFLTSPRYFAGAWWSICVPSLALAVSLTTNVRLAQAQSRDAAPAGAAAPSGSAAPAPAAGPAAPGAPAEGSAEDRLTVARRKFQEALTLKAAGDYLTASKLLSEVGAVKMTPQVHYHIADCDEHLGNLVAALGGYERALALIAGDVPEEFVAEVQTAVTRLRARIPKVVLVRGHGAEAARIELDQVQLSGDKVGSEQPVNPGPHEIVARATGYQLYRTSVTVEEQHTKRVVIDLVPIPEESKPAEARGYGAWPWVLGGAGVAGLVAGAVLLPVSQGKAAEVESICGGTNCEALSAPGADRGTYDQALGLAAEARSLEVAGWIAGGVGAGLLASGVVLYFLDPTRHTEQPQAGTTLVPSAPGSQAGLSLFSRF